MRDLSQGGARILTTLRLAVGTKGTLELSGVATPLPFTVRSTEGDALHVAFTLDNAGLARLGAALQGVGHQRAA
jgi:hypothetical protein